MPLPGFLAAPPRFLFFTGKGGVGKTSLASATALALADQGRRVLLVSTDPASNVSEVLGCRIGHRVTAISEVPGLWALEIDPAAAAEAYRERIVGPVRGLLPEAEIASITEQLSGSCTTEVAAFDEFTELLTDDDLIVRFDHIVFDTAPTGHTIRLLQLPGSWSSYLDAGKGDASCLGPLSGLDKHRATYAAATAALADPSRTRLVLVTRPHASAVEEAARTAGELAGVGMADARLAINGVLPEAAAVDDLGTAIRQRERGVLDELPPALADLPLDTFPLVGFSVIGAPALRALFGDGAAPAASGVAQPVESAVIEEPTPGTLAALVDQIEAAGPSLIMCLGKGGVGKTTVAAAIAVALAGRGHEVLLTTTDPAAHVDSALAGRVPHLEVARIDPVQATLEYRDRVMATKGKHLDDAGRLVLAEDLRSPCTEEVAVFGQFSRVVHEAKRRFVVVDTAPTGHTLLLLDAAGAYHRDIARNMGDSGSFTTPLMRLRDPAYTKAIVVTLAEQTPVSEAAELQDDLRRAGIEPWAWVIDSSLTAAAPQSPLLQQRAAAELPQIRRAAALTNRLAIIPLLPNDPRGPGPLVALATDPATAPLLA